MDNRDGHSDYKDFEAIVREARMQRSVALGNAIASVIAAIQSGLTRAARAIKSGLGGTKSDAQAGGESALDVPAHR